MALSKPGGHGIADASKPRVQEIVVIVRPAMLARGV